MGFFKPINPRLIRTHPLARNIVGAYLFGYGGRYVIEHAYGLHLSDASDQGTATTRVYGKVLYTNTKIISGSDAALPSGNNPFTFVYGGIPDPSTTGQIFNYGTTGANGQFRGFNCDTTTTIKFGHWGVGYDLGATTTAGNNATRRVVYAGTHDGTTCKIYERHQDDAFHEIASAARTLDIHKGASVTFFKYVGGSEYHTGYTNFVYFYNRALSAAELSTLTVDPYQIFIDQARPLVSYVILNAAQTVTKSDDLAQPWTDAATATLGFPAGHRQVSIEDKIIRNGSINGNNLALRDGIGFVVGPSGPVNIAVADLGIFLDDSLLKIGYGISVAD